MVALILCLMCGIIVFAALKITRKAGSAVKSGYSKFEATTLAALSKFEASADAVAKKLEAFAVAQENKKKSPQALSEGLFAIMSKIVANSGVSLLDGVPELKYEKGSKQPVGCKLLFTITTPDMGSSMVLSAYVAFDTGYATIVLFTPGMQKIIAALSAGYVHKEPSVIRAVASNKLHAIVNSEDEINRVIDLVNEEADESEEQAA